ncbi:unnamed protein product [Ixodes hexagonus]
MLKSHCAPVLEEGISKTVKGGPNKIGIESWSYKQCTLITLFTCFILI